jgi:hypothetical protein
MVNNTRISSESILENSLLSLELYPNPGAGHEVNLTIEGLSASEDVRISLYDVAGNLVYSQSGQADKEGSIKTLLVFANRLHPGMYMLVVTNDKHRLSRKLSIY